MSSIDKLTKLAERFERKISLAATAQAGEIANVLKDQGVWGTPNDLFAAADKNNIPSNVNVYFGIVVDSSLNVVIKPIPPMPGGVAPASLLQMGKDLTASFGPAMSQALKTGKIREDDGSSRPVVVAGTVELKWHFLKASGS